MVSFPPLKPCTALAIGMVASERKLMSSDTTPPAPPRPPTCDQRFSPLTKRIMAVNLLAPALLLVGLFYLGEYRRSLIVTELSALRSNGEIFSVALSESAVSPVGQQLLPDLAIQIVRRLAFTAQTRARLFAVNGDLVADSRDLLQPGGEVVEAENLEPPISDQEPNSLLDKAFSYLDVIYFWLPGIEDYPPYFENIQQRGTDYEEVIGAMRGEVWMAHRNMPDRSLVMSVALPVTRYKHTLGVLMLSKTSEDIDKIMYAVRKDTLQVFLVTLVFTILVSLYLGGTIARPIRILSRAAERIRHGHHRQHTIPQMTARDDEIGDLALALSEMTEALWTRMDAIEAFAADVSHEIKNPLTSLKSAVETTRLVKDPKKLQKLMAIIQDDVERLDRLITDISDASRLDAELSRAENKQVDLGHLLITLADIHGAGEGENGPNLHLDIEDDLIVDATEDRLMQVFRNLLSNAVSFSPPDAPIHLKAWRESGCIRVTVEDSGPGIAPGKEQAIFNRFYTERPEAEAFGRHSGLGLSISLQIIEAHGGTLKAETVQDGEGNPQGARFTVCLASV